MTAPSNTPPVQELIAGIRSESPVARERSADEVTDVCRGLDAAEVEALIVALVAANAAEDDEACRESQLNAIAEVCSHHDFDPGLLAPLRGIERTPQLNEYLDGLL